MPQLSKKPNRQPSIQCGATLALVVANVLVATHAIKATFDRVSFMDVLQPRFGETGTARTHLRRGLICSGTRAPFLALVCRLALAKAQPQRGHAAKTTRLRHWMRALRAVPR